MSNLKKVQIIDNGAVHKVSDKYPTLAREVIAHDKYSSSSWYGLSDVAYTEYLEFIKE